VGGFEFGSMRCVDSGCAEDHYIWFGSDECLYLLKRCYQLQKVVDHYDSNIYEPDTVAEIYVTQAVVLYYNFCTRQLHGNGLFMQCGESCIWLVKVRLILCIFTYYVPPKMKQEL